MGFMRYNGKLSRIRPNFAPLKSDDKLMTRVSFILAWLVFLTEPIDAAPRLISEITAIDQLGYECIDPKYLDEETGGPAAIAYTLAGEIRRPRTCLPEPCARALTPSELSALTGSEMILPVFLAEWDDYYARYADYCRKEVVPFGEEPLDPLMSSSDFWPLVLSPPVIADEKISGVLDPAKSPPAIISGLSAINFPQLKKLFSPPVIAPANEGNPSANRDCRADVEGAEMWLYDTSGTTLTCSAGGGTAAAASTDYSEIDQSLIPVPVPLPANLILLLTGVGALGFIRRRA